MHIINSEFIEMTKRILLIDGDVWIYRAAVITAEIIKVLDEAGTVYTVKHECNIEEAKNYFRNFVRTLEKELGATEPSLITISCSECNFRRELFPKYKATRPSKPIGYGVIKEWVEQNYPIKTLYSVEADDVMGILGTSKTAKSVKDIDERIIVTIDKDLRQINECLHYNPDKDEEGIIKLTKEEADRMFYSQILTGDTVDNYKGCPRVGAVGAKKLLDNNTPEEYWQAIVAEFEKKGLTEQDALTQARLAKILKSDDYDFKNKKVKLWKEES